MSSSAPKKDKVTALREVHISGAEDSLITSVYSDDGTPQKALHRLLIKCVNMLNASTRETMSVIIAELTTHFTQAGRSDWGNKTQGLKDKFNQVYEAAMATTSSTQSELDNKTIILFSEPLVKSISDISQIKALICGIPEIVSIEDIGPEVEDPIITNLRLCPELLMISSDKIAASVCTLLAHICDYPIPIMCSRKVGPITQSVLIQKNHVSMLSILINLAMNDNTRLCIEIMHVKDIITSVINELTWELDEAINGICPEAATNPEIKQKLTIILKSMDHNVAKGVQNKTYPDVGVAIKKEIINAKKNIKDDPLLSTLTRSRIFDNVLFKMEKLGEEDIKTTNIISFLNNFIQTMKVFKVPSSSSIDHNNYTHDDCQQLIDKLIKQDRTILIDMEPRELSIYNSLITLVATLSSITNKDVLDNLANYFKYYENRSDISEIHNSIVMVHKWTVNIANEAFKLQVDLGDLITKIGVPTSDLNTELNRFEIIGAALDGTYGHDYNNLKCITKLGEKFLGLLDRTDTRNAFGDKNTLPDKGKKNEDACMEHIFVHTPFSTLNQEHNRSTGQDMFVIRFSSKNHIVENKLQLQTRDSHWNIGASPFRHNIPHAKISAMVDFISGETAVTSEYVTHVKNAISDYNTIKRDTYFPNILTKFDPGTFIDEIVNSNKIIELASASGEFDGAGGTGIVPFVIDNGHVTETIIGEVSMKVQTMVIYILNSDDPPFQMSKDDYIEHVRKKWVHKNLTTSTGNASLTTFITHMSRIINDRSGIFETEDGRKLGYLLGKLANIVGIMNVPETAFDVNDDQIPRPTIESSILYIYEGVNAKVERAVKQSSGQRMQSSRKIQTPEDVLFETLAVKHPSIFTINEAGSESSNFVIPSLEPSTAHEQYISTYVATLGMGEVGMGEADFHSEPLKQERLSYLYDVLFHSIEHFDEKYRSFIATYSTEITIGAASIFLEEGSTDTTSSETSTKIGAVSTPTFATNALEGKWDGTVAKSISEFVNVQNVNQACSTSTKSKLPSTPTEREKRDAQVQSADRGAASTQPKLRAKLSSGDAKGVCDHIDHIQDTGEFGLDFNPKRTIESVTDYAHPVQLSKRSSSTGSRDGNNTGTNLENEGNNTPDSAYADMDTTSGQNNQFAATLGEDFTSPNNSDAASKYDGSVSGESDDGNDSMKILTDKASEDTQHNAGDIIVEMNTYIANVEHTLVQMTQDLNDGNIGAAIEHIENDIRERNEFILEHFANDARFTDIVNNLADLTNWITEIKGNIALLGGGGGSRKRGRRRARKRTQRKPMQRKRKRTQRNAVQRKRKNNKRTRRRR
jgi:hypothetical protein